MDLSVRLAVLAVAVPVLSAALVATDLVAPTHSPGLPVARATVEAEPAVRWTPRVAPPERVAPPVRPVPAPRPVVHQVARSSVRVARVRRTAVPFGQAQAEAVGQAAFARVNKSLPRGWRIVFEVYRGSWQGLADTGTRQVTIWVRPTDTPARLQVTVAHEMGHVLDYTALTDRDRQRYLAMRGRSDCRDPWYPRNGTSDYASPAGDFAEVYALWRGGRGDFRSRFAPQPSDLGPFVRFFSELEARQPQV